ncbi:vesicle-associated membrane protein 5 isoform X1 [Protopterus annectens]|uniref:vesicle-associated membrane protein 5 isoform X1 n=1 Tax=Protopterus annectens TaxID=7888 RepID=UPI001CF937A6|nr:vesicle-associated membrane protein 5 isoform X1 [Protopterus annectens]
MFVITQKTRHRNHLKDSGDMKLQDMHSDVKEVTELMRNNYIKVEERDGKLKDLEERSDVLLQKSDAFVKTTKTVMTHQNRRNRKLNLIIIGIVVVILVIVLVVIVYFTIPATATTTTTNTHTTTAPK